MEPGKFVKWKLKKKKHKEQNGSEAAVKGHYVAVRKINCSEKESDGDVHFVCVCVCVCVDEG